jgi:hypothetical protein
MLVAPSANYWYTFTPLIYLSLNKALQVYRNLPYPPPIPPEINQRHFTSFLFGRHCQVCWILLM